MKHARNKRISSVWRRALAAFSALLFCVSASGCAGLSSSTPYEKQLFAMDTFMQLRAYGDGADKAIVKAVDTIERLDGLLSVTDENSEIHAVNSAEGEAVKVSADTFDIIKSSLEFSSGLGGTFDITVYPVLRAWGFTGEEYRVPDGSELASLLTLVDDSAVQLDADALTVTVPAGCMIDLGGIAKGYAAEKTADVLKAEGVTSALLDLGSSTIRTIGVKPDGSLWSIAIRDPKDTYAYLGKVKTGEGSVSTSGGYERNFVGEDGRTYSHIIDPATGRPADNGILSVTVICSDAFRGDGLSTALCVMGPEKAAEYWRSVGGFDFIMALEDGSIAVTPGAAELFTPMGSYKNAEIKVIE